MWTARCILVLAIARSASSSSEGTKPEHSGGAGGLAAALDHGDECSSRSADGAPACALNALQARRTKASAHNGGSNSAGSVEEDEASDSGSSGTFESAPAHQGSWSNEGRCSGDRLHELLFIMRHGSSDKIEQMVIDRTNPKSPRFRKWLSRAEVATLTRNEVGLQALRAFLTKQGPISTIQETHDGDVVRVEAPVATWERVLNTQFSIHRSRDTDLVLIRAPSYALPRQLHAHVVGILKAVELGGPVPESDMSMSNLRRPDYLGTPCSEFNWVCERFSGLKALVPGLITPAVLRQGYNVTAMDFTDANVEVAMKASQLVYGSSNPKLDGMDVDEFLDEFSSYPIGTLDWLNMNNFWEFPEFKICQESPGKCAEANLQLQYMRAMSPWSKIGYFHMPSHTTYYEFLYKFAMDVSTVNKWDVISIPHGIPEAGTTRTAQHTFDMLARKLTLQGVTILTASGDDGAASSLGRSQKHGRCWAVETLGLQVNWPASSPYVTAVGATMGLASGHKEIVCSINATGPAAEATRYILPPLITSGGGFSKSLRRPAFQDGHHDNKARGTPDLALAGHLCAVVIGRYWYTEDGTGASLSTFAGMITLINAQRRKAGLDRVGWLNPTLYAHPEMFNDVTEGDNKCGHKGTPCCGGYEAGPGWDPTTGLGSPDFAKLAAILSTDNM